MLLTSYRYIVKELLVPFIMGVAVFTFILIMFQILKFTEFLVVQGVDYIVVLKLFYYLIVAFLPITIPVSFLFSVLLAFSRFASDNEIIAFKASGISIYQLMVPVFSISLIAALCTFYVSFSGGPWGNRNFENTLHKIGTSRATIQLREGFFNEGMLKDFILYAAVIIPDTDVMEKVFVYDDRDKDNPVIVHAKKAKLDIDQNTKKMELFLYDGYIIFMKNTGLKYRRANFNEYRVLLYEGSNIKDRIPNLPSMSNSELVSTMNDALWKKDAESYNKTIVEMHRRFAIPFACLIFGFLGIIFADTSNRNIQTGASFLSFIVMVLYWIIYITSTSLGSKGTMNPVLSVWLADMLFLMFGVYIFVKKS